MDIAVNLFPNRRLFKGTVKPTQTVGELLRTLKDAVAGRELLVDGSGLIPGILHEDPVNEYYRGMPGDIYRVEDFGKVRYRRVVRGELARKEVRRTSVRPPDDILNYKKAYETLMEMCHDRKYRGEFPGWTPETIRDMMYGDDMKITGLRDRRGRYVCIKFLPVEDRETMAKPAPLTEAIIPILQEFLDIPELKAKIGQKLPSVGDFDVKNTALSAALGTLCEILIIYNGPDYKIPANRQKYGSTLLQFMSVQQLTLNIMRHQDQPKFTLLEATDAEHRKEILDVYKLNGQVLQADKMISEYNLAPAEPGAAVGLIVI